MRAVLPLLLLLICQLKLYPAFTIGSLARRSQNPGSKIGSMRPLSPLGRQYESFRLRMVATDSKATNTPARISNRGKDKLTRKHEPSSDAALAKVVLLAGFEAFNEDLYNEVAQRLREILPELQLTVFTDRDIVEKREELEQALGEADAFFGSLLFDYDQVRFLSERIKHIPVRLVFESALELMSSTSIGEFTMAGGGGQAPAPVRALLSKFGSGKEEDRLAGYLNLLKIGPSLLRFVPGGKAADLKNWLEIYSYWNQGGLQNVLSMFLILGERYLLPKGIAPPPSSLKETPAVGLIHPETDKIFATPKEYMKWYEKHRQEEGEKSTLAPKGAPIVSVLLYRKHFITGQPYIKQMIRIMESQGLLPVPVYINGVEGHTIVRDLLTTDYELEQRKNGVVHCPTLKVSDAVKVDAIVNTIGFPLVGGPAGSMECGRRVDVATDLLAAKNVPYIIAAPLLIQDLKSWRKDGVQGLQQVVLYSLPELDGAVDTVVLGGLCGERIALVPERVRRLCSRVNKWVNLRRTKTSQRKVAILMYGFPPNVGAVGTAALLNVPASLEALLKEMIKEGYDLGPEAEKVDGEALVAALKVMSQQTVVARGFDQQQAAVDNAVTLGEECSYRVENAEGLAGAKVTGVGVPSMDLDHYLTKRMAKKVQMQWGDGKSIATGPKGELVVSGLQLGNIFIGVQPLLGVEGDPMRLMFERDLTPHPQYAAFYKWLQKSNTEGGFGADAILHLGMHGTQEWLPGSPLGNTAETWPDQLIGALPNAYIYAANNPSESILAKRRGYGTLISHNVPPYARAGLYKELATLKELCAEYREGGNAPLRGTIAAALESAGLFTDMPYESASGVISVEEAETMDAERAAAEFDPYIDKMYAYLLVLEQRLFSEGLHVLGGRPNQSQIEQYLTAYFSEEDLPATAVSVIASQPVGTSLSKTVAEVRSLGGQFSSVVVDENRKTALLTAEYTPDKAKAPKSPEEQYADTLFYGDWFRFQFLRLMSACGSKAAKDEIEQELKAAGGMDGGELEAGVVLDSLSKKVTEAYDIKRLLEMNTDELTNTIRALDGQYIRPGVGGDILRDGPGVLPTGRNIHALDPYRMPSPGAYMRGKQAADKILEQHVVSTGNYPETVAVTLWGLDSIKTRGESVAIALALVGARPVKEGTGRVVKYELIPLEELGRPRVDVLASLSGIFRDSFANVVDLLDDLFETASYADEPLDMNYIKKHTAALAEKGVERPSSRLFSNPPSDFGSMVNERVGTGDWDDASTLGDTWQGRNAFSYGRGKERGANRSQILNSLLGTTERIVQEIDSVEYGITDIQEYYANTGALKKAAENAKGKGSTKKVNVSIVEAFSKTVEPKELEATLRLEYRAKMLNPKWANAMVKQGSGGAYEISQRMTALIGWSATAGFQDEWVYDGVAERYALDKEMAAKLKKSNPEAFSNILKRMLEGAGRGFWSPPDDVLKQIQEQYADIEDQIELGSGKFLPQQQPKSAAPARAQASKAAVSV